MFKFCLQKGFTLIELMIVVMIIGVLAALAIPQYQDYVTRSKWADIYVSIEPLKMAIAQCVQFNAGQLANCDTEAELLTNAGYPGITALTNATVSIAPSTAAIVLAGASSVGNCGVTWTPSLADSNKISWAITNTANTVACSKFKTGV